MFFTLSKTLAFVVYPLPLLLLTLLGIVVWYHRKRARLTLLIVLIGFYSFSISYTADQFMRWIEVPRISRHALAPHYDVVIVLSGMTDLQLSRAGQLEFTNAVDRILAGIDFVKQGIGDVLLISGGSGSLFDQSRSEAVFLKDFAVQQGLLPAQILVEAASRNTYENALHSARLLHERPYRRVLLITSASHMRRAVAAFHKQGIRPDIYPVDFRGNPGVTPLSFIPTAKSLVKTQTVMRELVGILMYRLQGYI